MRRTLERNPIGWLQQYSTATRLTKWGWCLFIMAGESFLVAFGDSAQTQLWVALLLALGLAASAAGSFSRERQSGALELILVTPLSVGQVIFGRFRGVWGQFLPALALVGAVGWFLFRTGGFDLWPEFRDPDNNLNSASVLLLSSTFITIPLVGFYFSLSQRHFMAAWLLTLGACLMVPWLAVWGGTWFFFAVNGIAQMNGPEMGALFAWTTFLQIVIATVAGRLLYRDLRRRRFALVS